MRNKSFIALMLFSISLIANSNSFRIVVPDSTELSGQQLKEGELVLDSSDNKLKVFHDNILNPLKKDLNEKLPAFYKSATGVTIYPGEVLINGKKYKNTTSLVCSYSTIANATTGVSGYEGTSPSTARITYLFLIPDPTGDKTKYMCILSGTKAGPTSAPNVPFRLLGSYWSTATFISHGGYTKYSLSTYLKQLPVINTSTCTAIDMSFLPTNVESYRVIAHCSGTSTFQIYNDDTCTLGAVGVCNSGSSGTYGSSWEASGQLYYKGNAAGTNYAAIRSTVEPITE